ncbi:MAG: exodeoxyribonuclease III [Hyphomicrobiales bacterium]|nr:exodeoxyribonuclease III [Hyphomicrobiales bacterium]
MPFRIAAWNINSVRLRAGLAQRLIEERAPDVLCLQEIKCRNEDFPHEAFAAFYPHMEVNGQAGYHGLATLSKAPLRRLPSQSFCGTEDCRHLAVEAQIGDHAIVLHNMYIPSGGDDPNPETNAKFRQKLIFLHNVAAWFAEDANRAPLMAMLGDFNVAPLENDVWSHKQMLNVVSHTPVEMSALERLRDAGRWIDPFRERIPPSEKLYSWWSYRARDWRASNRGRRLDHIWVTGPLARRVTAVEILSEARGWPQPSDHVPVILDLDIA